MVIVDLSETGRHFSAARSGSSDEDKIFRQWNMVVVAKSIFAEDGICIVWISVDLVSFPYSVLFSLEIFFEFEDDVKHIADVDVVDDDMRFESDILFDDSHHLINIIFVIDILVAQLSIG